MSFINRLISGGGGIEQREYDNLPTQEDRRRAADLEERTLNTSAFVPPPQVGVMDDFVGVHRAMASMTVLACVNLLADTIASLPWKAYRRDNKGIPKEVKPQPKILSQPYPGFDLFQWKWMTVASMALRGNAYSYVTSRDKLGYPTALLPLHPDIVFLERRPDLLMWFDPIYRIMGEEVASADMIHMRRFTMPGEPWGLSPVKQAAVAIGLALSSEEYGARYFKEAANPSGLLSTEQDLDEEAVKRQQKNWIASHGGRRLPAILTNGFKWETLSIRPDESQFLECTVPGTPVTMADGTRKPVEELRVGDRVMAWNGSKLEASPVKAIGTPPLKPIVKITTARGRELTCTADHPILAVKHRVRANGVTYRASGDPDIWVPAGDLQLGQRVRIALGHLEDHTGRMESSYGYLIGAMVGDGNFNADGTHWSWSSNDPGNVAKMADAVEAHGGTLRPKKGIEYRLNTGGGHGAGNASIITTLFRQTGLVGSHSHTKFVPDMITAAGPAVWRGFLSGYFDADGCMSDRTGGNDPSVATWASSSRPLLEGCQHLLALLGINSSIYRSEEARENHTFPNGNYATRLVWSLHVTGRSELAKLAAALDIGHTEKRRKLAKYLNPDVSKLRAGQFKYDRILSVEHISDAGETIGVEIANTHTHVTGGLISHNTRQFQRSEICIMYRVPPILIGDTKETTAWGTGVEQITLGAVTYTFRAWTSCIESVISNCLPRGMFVRFDYDALLSGDVIGRWGAYSKAIGSSSGAGFITANEIRAREEMDPVAGGDTLLQPSLMVPMGTTFPAETGDPAAPTQAPAKPPAGLPMPPVGGGENHRGSILDKYNNQPSIDLINDALTIRGKDPFTIRGADGRRLAEDGRLFLPTDSGQPQTNGHHLVGVNGAPLHYPGE